MKKLLKFFLFLIVFTICLSLSLTAYAHPGKTDSNGGHTDHSTGEYHYHHGYPAHNHSDFDGDGVVDCPYNFDDKTDSGSRYYYSDGTSQTSSERDRFSIPEETEVGIVKIWIVCLLIALFVAIILRLALAIRQKNLEIRTAKQNHEAFIRSESERIHNDLQKLNVDLAFRYGVPYLYSVCGTPSGDYLGDDSLPSSTNNDNQKWGNKYTFYLSSFSFTSVARYHRNTCRYANKQCPINAYTIHRFKFNYEPCAICRPSIPDVEWVSKYLAHKSFLERHGISVPHHIPQIEDQTNE